MAEPDEASEAYKRIARAHFDSFIDLRQRAFEAQVAYGRWLLNWLLLMNGGSIVAITQLDTLAKPLFMAAGAWFVAGIGFTFVAGAATWFNWSFATEVYDNWADPHMIETPEAWPKDDDDLGAKVTASRWMAISMAIIALYCLVGGAAEILNFLRIGIELQ